MRSLLCNNYLFPLILIIISYQTLSAQESAPGVYLFDPQKLLSYKTQYAAGALKNNSAFQKLMRRAKKTLNAEKLSVTTKSVVPPSGDKHDYMSQSPYFWPDPSKPKGLPYMRRDGEKNPEAKNITDADYIDKIILNVEALALAYYFTGERQYSAKANEFLSWWFLNDSTKMNPNMNFAQGIPGKVTGRCFGLIESHRFSNLMDAFALLQNAEEYKSIEGPLKQWFTQFLNWMQTSPIGSEESNSKNNHGTWYDVQLSAIALYVGKPELAKSVIEKAKTRRIAFQIEPDGAQPLELERTRSWSYSLFNLQALFSLAVMGDKLGIDLWRFKTDDGRSMKIALDYILPSAADHSKWTEKQITDFNVKELRCFLKVAADHIDKSYNDWFQKIFPNWDEDDIRYILY